MYLRITVVVAALVLGSFTMARVAGAQRSGAPAGDDGIVTGAVPWTVDADSVAGERLWAGAAVEHRRRRRAWYSYSAATYRVRPTLIGARFEGIIYGFYNGRPYGCSGTVVDSPNASIVWTAGHCIFNREYDPHPYTNIVFVPDAEQGASPDQPVAPYGVWPAVRWAVTREWYVHGGPTHIKRALLTFPWVE
jgi:hypothetical protein